jgi:hypothetical protein
MYYHCIAIVESLKNENLDPHVEEKYRNQLFKCEKRLGQLANHSEVNYRMYHRMVVSIYND